MEDLIIKDVVTLSYCDQQITAENDEIKMVLHLKNQEHFVLGHQVMGKKLDEIRLFEPKKKKPSAVKPILAINADIGTSKAKSPREKKTKKTEPTAPVAPPPAEEPAPTTPAQEG
jgi:hypothetical protein